MTGYGLSGDDAPFLRLRVEVWHDPRKSTNVPAVKKRIQEDLNVRNETASNVRISVGHEASAVFVDLVPGKKSEETLSGIAEKTATVLRYTGYADDVDVKGWRVEAVVENPDQQTGEDTEEADV